MTTRFSKKLVGFSSAIMLVLLGVGCLLLGACGSNSSGGSGSSSSTSTGTEDMTLLRAQGTYWVKADGSPFILRGTNLGNWLLQEFWMMGQSTEAVNDQCTLEAVLEERFGFDERERLMTLFRDNWIAERDWDLLQDFGMNVVRLPFIWNLIEDEHNPYHLRDDAWHYLDLAIDQAEAREMYVILDLHGAVGSQGWEHHSGCSDLNEYWDTPEYQERTIWLWQQIAERYKDRIAIAGYGLLNEPWGTSPENLADVMETLYHAVREVDEDHIIILPGHAAGIDAYGDPADRGMTNVAFEMHFYPGIFGWGEIGYEVHRDWLLCGPTGTTGVCEWDARLTELAAPFLIGEFQPWTGQGLEQGARITRATYDTYAQYGWAATNWSYKVLTNTGGQGGGTWGMVTNQQDIGVLTKSNTWVCPGWDSSIADSCDVQTETVTPEGEGEQLYYLVIKAGACCGGELDVSFDQISLIDPATEEELIINGDFGSADGWTEWLVDGEPTIDYNHEDASSLPTGSDGPVLRIIAGEDANGGIYQAITLEGGKSYVLNGVFSDNGSTDAWAEIYLVTGEPQTGVDVTGEALPQLDFHTASLEEIEALFESFGSLEYDVHHELMHWLTTDEPVGLFDLPAAPMGLTRTLTEDGVVLDWDANSETDLDGYRVYRSTVPGTGYTLLAEVTDATTYTDAEGLGGEATYYYWVTAVRGESESYPSDEVIGDLVYVAIPGLIQAENYSDRQGNIQLEDTEDSHPDSSAHNIAHLEPGYWFEYAVEIEQAGLYTVEYRVASQTGSTGFQLLINGEEIDSRSIPTTGGWQSWQTLSSDDIELPEGQHILRFAVQGNQWNFGWVRFTAVSP